MAISKVIPPDIELWLTKYIRAQYPKYVVTNKEPVQEEGQPFPEMVIVVRDDSGAKESAVSFSRTVGISVIGGTRRKDQATNDLARSLYGYLTSDEICFTESPFASVNDAFGPYAVSEDQDRARRYFTIDYTVVGEISI